MERDGVKNEYKYEKTMICLYPHAEWILGQMRQSIVNRAVFSYRSSLAPEALAEALLRESYYCDEMEYGMECVGEAMAGLNELETALIRYRCWNSGEALKEYLKTGGDISGKTLLRRYRAGIRKVAAILHRNGIDFNWFQKNVLHYDWGRKVYRKVASPKFNKRKTAREGKSPLSAARREREGING